MYPRFQGIPSSSGGVAGPSGGSSTDNALVRWDGTTGDTVQNSLLYSPDTDGLTTPALALATDTDTGLSWPAANTLRIAAGGKASAIFNTATNAVNYLDITPSAASANIVLASAGTDSTIGITVTPKGNGNLLFNSTGTLQIGGTTSSYPTLAANGTSGVLNVYAANVPGTGGINTSQLRIWDTGPQMVVDIGRSALSKIGLQSGGVFGFTSSATSADSSSLDAALSRVAAAVIGFGTAAPGSVAGWFQYAGQSFLAADATNATTTMAATGLSVNVTQGRKYAFRAVLMISDTSTGALDGYKFDWDGSTAAATNFRAWWREATEFVVATQTTALATDYASAGFGVVDDLITVWGSFEPSSTGTFALRFAQTNHNDGNITLYRGSHLLVYDMP